jgi:hypothetical protein
MVRVCRPVHLTARGIPIALLLTSQKHPIILAGYSLSILYFWAMVGQILASTVSRRMPLKQDTKIQLLCLEKTVMAAAKVIRTAAISALVLMVDAGSGQIVWKWYCQLLNLLDVGQIMKIMLITHLEIFFLRRLSMVISRFIKEIPGLLQNT